MFTTSTFKLASHPFNHPDADLILRSSDKQPVDFRVFKLLLSLSSSFFSVLFTLPQPSSGSSCKLSSSDSDLLEDGIPVVQMAEDKRTLEVLLGYCYPISTHEMPHISSLSELQKIADAASKFEMDGIIRHVREELVAPRFIESQPLRVYAIAYRYGWASEVKLAARYTLRHTIPGPYAVELERISASAYFRLQQYHDLCGKVAASRARIQETIAEPEDGWIWLTCERCTEACAGPGTTALEEDNNNPHHQSPSRHLHAARQWWSDWIRGVAYQLQVRPRGETARNFDLMSKALLKAEACVNCGKRARGELESFSQMLAAQVETDISSVKLSLDFDDWD